MSFSALVTGASGFVGRRLVRYLDSLDDWTVKGCDIASSDEASFRACDIASPEDVESVIAWAGSPTHVFHLAAVTFVPDAKADPTATMRINYGGTVNIVNAMKAHTPNARLVFVSTSEVYGPPQTLPIDEEHALNPGNPYAEAKAKSDEYCRTECGELDIVRMRPFNHSGAGQSDKFVLSEFARRVARIELGKSDPIIRVGNLSSWKDFTHVDDVIRAYELAARKGVAGEAYNVCSGETHEIKEAMEILRALATREFDVKVDPNKYRKDTVGKLCGSYEKLQRATQWTPARSFQSIIEELFEYWMNEEA